MRNGFWTGCRRMWGKVGGREGGEEGKRVGGEVVVCSMVMIREEI